VSLDKYATRLNPLLLQARLEDRQDGVGMPLARCVGLAGVAQFLKCVGSDAFEKPIARRIRRFGDHQRLVDQRPQELEDLPGIDSLVAKHLLRSVHRERSREHPGSTEDCALIDFKQTVTPIERLAQRLVSAHGRAHAPREHPKSFVQALPHPRRPQQGHTRGGQFNGQWQTIEPPADVHGIGTVLFGENEA
jgi:hypothetical protein